MIPSLAGRVTAIVFEPRSFSDASSFVVWVGTRDGVVLRIDGETTRAFRAFPSSAVRTLTFSADAASILTSDEAGTVSVRRTADWLREDDFTSTQPISRAHILGERAYATIDVRRNGFIWSPDDGGALVADPICVDGVKPAAFDDFGAAPLGNRFTLRSSLNWMLWDRPSNRVTSTKGPVDGSKLAYMSGITGLSETGGYFFIHWDELKVFDVETAKRVWDSTIVRGASCAALSDDGNVLIVGGREGHITVVSGPSLPRVSVRPTADEIERVTLAPDASVVCWLDDSGGFGIVDATSGAELVTRARGLELVG
ncbi:MAG TPA: hypothetical protein VN706_23395 [Gemmatimonadaceae bacterium]|nr:hypothetical protein [Gemmatimonadaceae bacterium]